MENLELLINLHRNANRQGPGGAEETQKAMSLAMLDKTNPLRIADIGCGTGASSIVLAKELNAHITAVDFLSEFIEILVVNARREGLEDKISPLVCSMENLPFDDEEFDVIWSEGAIYNMGFENGVKSWRRFLKPGGVLAVSEISWTTGSRPQELQAYWDGVYPEIDTASSKIKILEDNGWSPVAYFLLPEHCWLDNYYRLLQRDFADFLDRYGSSKEAQSLVAEYTIEIEMYEKYKEYFSYGVYIATKLEG